MLMAASGIVDIRGTAMTFPSVGAARPRISRSSAHIPPIAQFQNKTPLGFGRRVAVCASCLQCVHAYAA